EVRPGGALPAGARPAGALPAEAPLAEVPPTADRMAEAPPAEALPAATGGSAVAGPGPARRLVSATPTPARPDSRPRMPSTRAALAVPLVPLPAAAPLPSAPEPEAVPGALPVAAGADPAAPPRAAAGGRVSTGAGCSGSAPFTAFSIHATCLPSLYVWIALKVIVCAFGSGPALIENSPYSPGLIPSAGLFAVHSMVLTTSVTSSPSSVLTGLASFVVVSRCVQPGTGRTDTAAIGASVGSCTASFVVAAVALSVGTRKVITPPPPGTASVELTDTWASAGAAVRPTSTAANAPATARRRIGGMTLLRVDGFNGRRPVPLR